jgi:hypothetical protein
MAGNGKRISAGEIAAELDLDRRTVYQMLKHERFRNSARSGPGRFVLSVRGQLWRARF